MDPLACRDCHPKHFEEWLGSMHAYAADDPVFRATNQRGQRETNGELGDFCVQCHAPIAHQLGLTKDGLNIAELPSWSRGITCFSCHNVNAIARDHNNGLVLANDNVMRGGLRDPVDALPDSAAKKVFHGSAYSDLHDGSTLQSSEACGSCHDVVNGHGLKIEKTLEEWRKSMFGHEPTGLSCSACHMRADDLPVATSFGSPPRLASRHDHRFVGVDRALIPFPDAASAPGLEAAQAAGIEAMRANALCASACVVEDPANGGRRLSLWLHNEAAGHNWPSGVSAHRRAWVEVVAYQGETPVYQSGVVGADGDSAKAAALDPTMWMIRDTFLDANGAETHFSWQTRAVQEATLPVNDPGTLTDAERTTWRERVYHLNGLSFDRIDVRVRLQPIGVDILDLLIQSGDLAPEIRAAMSTSDVAPSRLSWPSGPTTSISDTGYGQCVSTSNSCGSPFICSTPFGCIETSNK
jgi:hypothetical protein